MLDRRERLTAQKEGRPKRMLTNYDYLIGIEDFTRMGGIRYKEEEGDDYINASAKYLVPPLRVFVPYAMLVMRLSWQRSAMNCQNNAGSTS